MSNCIENFGLEELMKDETTATNFFGMIAEKGKAIIGYNGSPYINYHLGDAQMIIRTVLDESKGSFTMEGFDTHCSGASVWKVVVQNINVDFRNGDKLSKRIVVRPLDSNGMAVVNVVNADVLPSYADEEIITLQMIAFAHDINYYEDEEEYYESVKPDELGRKFGVADGSVLAVGLLSEKSDVEIESVTDITQIRGTVKKLFKGPVSFDDENTFYPFVKGVIDTNFGELEFIHSVYDISEEKAKKIKVGAVVEFYATLSGDAAIFDYEESFVKDEENHLHAYAYALSHGEIDRLKNVLSKDVYYYSETSKKEFFNSEDFIKYAKYVYEEGNHCTAWYATVDSISEDVENDTKPLYISGKRCLALFYGDDENYSSLAFIDTNEEGLINRIYLSEDPRYNIIMDELPYCDEEVEYTAPASIEEAMVCRAHFNNLIDNDISEQDLWEAIRNLPDKDEDMKRITVITEALKLQLQENGFDDAFFENVFGYFFMKGVQSTLSNENEEIIYDFNEMMRNELPDIIECSENDLLKKCIEFGKRFFKDFRFNFNTENSTTDDFNNDFIRSLIFVREIGRRFALKNM